MAGERPGRKRSEQARQAILEATRDELAAVGYDRLSIDRLAAAAGVGKQTVYRWYDSKNALIAESILRGHVIPVPIDVPDSGDLRRDLRGWLAAFAMQSRTPIGAALVRAGAAAAAESAEIAERYHEATRATEDALALRIESGIASGDLPATTPARTVAEVLVGAVLFRVIARRDITDEYIDELLLVMTDRRS